MTGLMNYSDSLSAYGYNTNRTGFAYSREIIQSGKKSDLVAPPLCAAGNLILILSTGQKILGGFNFHTYKFYAHSIGPESTAYSLGNLDIHDFVVKWEEGYSYIAKINEQLMIGN